MERIKNRRRYAFIILKIAVLGIVFILGWPVWAYLLDIQSHLAIPAFIGWVLLTIAGAWWLRSGKRECPKCGIKASQTGMGGDEYKQWHCSSCEEYFWTTCFWEDYE